MTTTIRIAALAVAAALAAPAFAETNPPSNVPATGKIATSAAKLSADQKKELAKSALAGKTVAKTVDSSVVTKPAPKRQIRVVKSVDMKIKKLQAVKGSDGNIVYLADGGRFAFTGPLIDVWDRKELKGIDEIEKAVTHINLARLGIKPENVSFTVGSGKEEAWVFIDPNCGWCHRLVDEISEDKDFFTDYKVHFVIVPILGDDSSKKARKFYCADDIEPSKLLEAYRSKDGKLIDGLKQQASCSGTRERDVNIARRILDINSVPFIVAPDGRFMNGKPQSVRDFFENGKPRVSVPNFVAPGVLSPEQIGDMAQQLRR